MSGQNKEYINSTLNPLLQQIVQHLLENKPSDPLPFMINWLQARLGIDPNYSQRQELLELRQEVARLKHTLTIGSQGQQSHSDDSQVDDQQIDISATKKAPRAAVSAQAYGQYNKKEDFVPRVVPKSDQQKEKIAEILSKSFMFAELQQNEKRIVIDAMEQKKFDSGDMVITQGEDGYELYVVFSGKLRCFKRLEGGQEKFFKYYNEGEAFGELALLYNAPRAACIQAEEPSVLLSLDRGTFNNIVKEAAIKRRERYEEFLQKVSLLEDMDPYERSQLADALKSESIEQGTTVIREGEEGNVFYILEEGSAIATKVVNEGEPPATVKEYGPGDYFGELALIKNQPRAANIIATSSSKVVVLDRHSFKRLLGPIEGLLNRNASKYEEILASIRHK